MGPESIMFSEPDSLLHTISVTTALEGSAGQEILRDQRHNIKVTIYHDGDKQTGLFFNQAMRENLDNEDE